MAPLHGPPVLASLAHRVVVNIGVVALHAAWVAATTEVRLELVGEVARLLHRFLRPLEEVPLLLQLGRVVIGDARDLGL